MADTSAPVGEALVEAAAAGDPFGRLARHAGDRVEVGIVVEQHRIVDLRDGGNQEVDGRCSAMLAALRERRLRAGRDRFGASIERKRRKVREIARELVVPCPAPS